MQLLEIVFPCKDSIFTLSTGERLDLFSWGMYHPPNPLYDKDILAECLQATIVELHHQNEHYSVILAGDFNQFSHSSILSTCMGFEAAYVGPTHEGHVLDRVYTFEPLYSSGYMTFWRRRFGATGLAPAF